MKKQLLALMFAFVFVLLGALTTKAQDDTIIVRGTDQNVTHDCEGRDVMVSGISHLIRLVGDCPNVTVSGTDNRVYIEMATVIRVSGVDNVITYRRSANGKRPKISNSGVNNSVRKE